MTTSPLPFLKTIIMRKTYGYLGVAESILQIPVGKASIKVTFKDGVLDERHPAPAHMETENPIVIAILDKEARKPGSRIVVLNTTYTEQEKAAIQKKGAEITTNGEVIEKKVYEEAESLADAINILKSLGVKATQMRNALRVREAAERLNVEFPNVKFN